jgi:hypothetical protein
LHFASEFRDAQLNGQVDQLAQRLGNNFCRVTIDGFDELLAELDFILRDIDHFGEGWEEPAPESAPDELPVSGATIEEIDLDLALATLSRWASKLQRGAVNAENIEALMLELRLAVKVGDKIAPTLGGLLLFGRKPDALSSCLCPRSRGTHAACG